MPRYPVTHYHNGDIVLLDLRVYRYHRNPATDRQSDPNGAAGSSAVANHTTPSDAPTTPGRSTQDNRGKPWVNWFAEYQLQSISILFKGSDYTEEESVPSDDGEIDE